jgi:hypothetical protein
MNQRDELSPVRRPQLAELWQYVRDPFVYMAVFGVLLIAIAAYASWSSRGTLRQGELHVGRNRLQVASSDGVCVIGVVEDADWGARFRPWRTPRPGRPLGGVLARGVESPISVVVVPNGWGIGAQYWVLAMGGATMPLWWWFVHRSRRERARRVREGLCRGCGYDIRMSPHYCPECGRYIGRLI